MPKHMDQGAVRTDDLKRSYLVRGMDCGDCARGLERAVCRVPGVDAATVDFATAQMRVAGPADEAAIRAAASKLGYTIEAAGAGSGMTGASATAGAPAVPARGPAGFLRFLLAQPETRPALAGGALLILAGGLSLGGAPALLVEGLVLGALVVAGLPIFLGAWRQLRYGRTIGIQALMSLAAIGALLIGETWEGATVMVLFALAESLEAFSVDRARDSLRALTALAPTRARRLRASAAAADPSVPAEESLPVEAIEPGDRILVLAGERIPIDGTILAGAGDINQAPVTGESMPVFREPGDPVYAGTVNGSAALEIQATRRAADSTLARIIHLVEEAQANRAPTQRLIDRFAGWYTPLVVALAAAAAILPPLLFGAPFLDAEGQHGWLYRGLTLLVIACPCALVLSAPVTVISAITAAARKGVLFKGGAALESLGTVRAIAFDKTGTLTLGQPALTQVQAAECLADECLADKGCGDCAEVLALAAALERRSAHPLARAVVAAAEARGLAEVFAPAEAATALPGRGLQGRVGGKLATVGSHALFDAEHGHAEALCRQVDAAEARGQTTLLVCDGDRVRGFLALADAIHPDSAEAVRRLHAMGLSTVMLTGDNAVTAREVGRQVGVRVVKSGLMPEDKSGAVAELRARFGRVAMVGDGINDAPALAAADLGIAVGGAASAQAMETAQIVLLADGIRRLPYAFQLSRFTRRRLFEGIAFSLAAKLAFVLLTLAGVTSLWLAILADMGVSLVVIFNGMRPLRLRDASDRPEAARA